MPQSNGLGVLQSSSARDVALSVPQRNAILGHAAEAATATAAATAAACASDAMTQRIPRARLLAWNAALALFHAGLAALTLGLGTRDLTVDLYKSAIDFRYVDANRTARGDPWELVPVYARAGSLHFTWWVASFFLLSSLFHALNATLLRRVYLRNLERCYTPTRWTEYFFSATVMIVIIGYTLGIRDRETLIAIGALVATTMPFGYWVEVVARPASADAWTRPLAHRLFPWVLGHVPQTVAWFVIVLRFYDGALTSEDRAPAFVHAILWLELALFFSFGAASLLSQVYPPRLFYRGEIAFQVLSLASKGLLGGLLIANVLMLSRFEEIYD